MSTTRPGPMNIEARALAEALLSEDRNVYQVALEYERETAAEALHGGRVLTEALARFGGPAISREMMAENPTRTWHYNIDPAGSYGWGDERRGPESREAWRRIARYGTEGRDTDWGRVLPYLQEVMPLTQAEAMLDWPIYRAAIVDTVLADLHGQASEAEDAILDTLAHCAGIRWLAR